MRHQIHMPCYAPIGEIRNKMNNDSQMAIAIALPGFNDLVRTMTPIFLLTDNVLNGVPKFSE